MSFRSVLTPSVPTRALWYVIAATSAFHLWAAGAIGLSVDEAYYWHWSLHPGLGYHDHPPLVAWAIAASSMLLGDEPAGVRLLFVLWGAGFQLAFFSLVRTLSNEATWFGFPVRTWHFRRCHGVTVLK